MRISLNYQSFVSNLGGFDNLSGAIKSIYQKRKSPRKGALPIQITSKRLEVNLGTEQNCGAFNVVSSFDVVLYVLDGTTEGHAWAIGVNYTTGNTV